MSHAGTASPYRAPCWGWAGLPTYFGGCQQHKVSAHSHIERKQNTTTAPQCGDSTVGGGCADGSSGAPYTRTVPDGTNTVFCAGSPCCCQPWEEPVLTNTYASYGPPVYLDLSSCYKFGFKNLYAIKQWHGHNPFTADESCTSGGAGVTTRYLTKAVSVKWVSGAYEADEDRTLSIGRYTGKVTQSGCTDTPNPDTFSGWSYPGDFLTARDMVLGFLGVDYAAGAWIGPSASSSDPWLNVILALNDTPGNAYLASVVSQSVSATELHFVFSPQDGVTLTVDVVLSDSYTSDDVNADIATLLGYWNLCDDLTYPWRQDGNCTSGPLMTYFERAANTDFSGLDLHDCSAVDGGPETGEVLGAPTTPGYDPYFNFRQEVWHFDSGVWHQTGWGEAAPAWAKHATQWTNANLATLLPPGGFTAFNAGVGTNNDALIVGCWAETIIPTFSHNFDRPCGEHDIAERIAATQTCDGSDTTYAGDFLYPAAKCYCNDRSQVREMDGTCAAATDPAATDQWNDVGRKGDFVVHVYSFDYRDDCKRHADPGTFGSPTICGVLSGIEARQLCAGGSACRPFAIFITPIDPSCPSESWLAIPANAMDSVGTKWQALPRPWMADPLWQPPATPCSLIEAGVGWAEDDGSCQEDTDPVHYYPMRPWEEARTTVPSGAPAFPTGVFLDPSALSVADINGGATSTDGNIWNPPANGSCPSPMPWQVYLFQQDCIAAEGRFAADYQLAAEDRTLDLPLI